jgi:hypothetical protein
MEVTTLHPKDAWSVDLGYVPGSVSRILVTATRWSPRAFLATSNELIWRI